MLSVASVFIEIVASESLFVSDVVVVLELFLFLICEGMFAM